MSEKPLPPGIVQNPEEPVPFFRTVDLSARPKWDDSVSYVKELSRYIKDVPEDRQNIDLAFEMQKTSGKDEAVKILEQVQKHITESLFRRRVGSANILEGWTDRLKTARGILGTPNWKDPNKLPPPIKFSIK